MSTWLEYQAKRTRRREAAKKAYRLRRQRLLARLGGVCVYCGCAVPAKLEFDHIKPATWPRDKTNSRKRLKIYEQEAAAGLLQILCSDCNKKKSWKEDQQVYLPLFTVETCEEPF